MGNQQTNKVFFFFFFEREFQSIASAPNSCYLSSDQDTNYFLCKREVNFRSLIKPQETLPIKLTKTHTN